MKPGINECLIAVLVACGVAAILATVGGLIPSIPELEHEAVYGAVKPLELSDGR